MRSATTIKSLSKEMKVSISTISKALNDSHEISEKTKIKIKRKALELNYIPNNAAKALKGKRTNMLAIIVPKINSIVYSNILSKIQEKAFKNDYRIVVLESFYCNKIELECLSAVNDGCVDGVIIIREYQMKTIINERVKTNMNYKLSSVVLRINEFETVVDDEFISKKCFSKLMCKIENSRKYTH